MQPRSFLKNYLKAHLSKMSKERVFLSSAVTLFLATLFSTIIIFYPQPKVPIPQPQVLPAGTDNINFKTYKGLNFPWGINSRGTSTWNNWLSSQYDEAATDKAFDHIKSMGVKTVGIWLWLDRMLIKDSNWGTDSYRTQFDPTFKANWESFLRMVKAKDMEVIVIMFPARNGVQPDPYNLEGDIFTGPERGPKWRNYTQAVKDWISLYSSSSEFGPAIASWQGIKEASDGSNYTVVHDFLVDFYQAVKSTGTTQPVGIDNSPYNALPVTDPKNQYLFTDAADYYNLHIYRDDGAIPDTSRLDKPFIIGEGGAAWNVCTGGGLKPCPSGQTTRLYSPDFNLTAVRNLYTNGLSAGAKTVMVWDWNDNSTIATQTYTNGNLVFAFGNAGQWIADWSPNSNSGTNPTATPTPTASTTPPEPTPQPQSNNQTNAATPATTPTPATSTANLSPPANANPTLAVDKTTTIQTNNAPTPTIQITPSSLQPLLDQLIEAQSPTKEATSSSASQAEFGKTAMLLGTFSLVSLLFGLFAFVMLP